MIFRRIPASVYAWMVAVVVVGAVVAIIAMTSSWHRTTRDELFAAASKPDAVYSYGYTFSADEEAKITKEARTYIGKDDVYGCSWYHDSDRLAEYQCDIEVALRRYSDDFVPFGYVCERVLFDKRGIMYGMVVVKTAEWKPGLAARPSGSVTPSAKPVASNTSR